MGVDGGRWSDLTNFNSNACVHRQYLMRSATPATHGRHQVGGVGRGPVPPAEPLVVEGRSWEVEPAGGHAYLEHPKGV